MVPIVPTPPAALLGLGDCEGSQHGGSAVHAALAAAGATDAASPNGPAAKRVRLELPSGVATAAAAAAAGAAGLPRRPSLVMASGAGTGAVPALSASRLERELERALKAFIRIKWVALIELWKLAGMG